MSATIRDDPWNVLNMQHITQNSKRWDYSDPPGGGHKKIEGPAQMTERGHHIRKSPYPHQHSSKDEYNIPMALIQWDRVTHICVSKLGIIGSNNGLSPGRRQAIICINGVILLIATNINEILIEIYTFSFKKMMAILSRPQCLNILWFE